MIGNIGIHFYGLFNPLHIYLNTYKKVEKIAKTLTSKTVAICTYFNVALVTLENRSQGQAPGDAMGGHFHLFED